MEPIGNILSYIVIGLAVIAVASDELAHLVESVALPLTVLLIALCGVRLVWFYTSRW